MLYHFKTIFNQFKNYRVYAAIGLTFMVGLVAYRLFYSSSIHPQSVKIAVIYAERIKQESIPYQDFERFFNAEREKLHLEFVEKESNLRKDYESQKAQKRDKKKLEKSESDFHEKVRALDNEIIQRKDEFSKTMQINVEYLEACLKESIQDVVKRYGFNLVLNAEVYEKILVLYADKGFDITDEIIANLNRKKAVFK
ncbi:MAG: hypothetical protein NEHIOOID_00642 [Holosporales bacterium]